MHKMRFAVLLAMSLPQGVALLAQTATATQTPHAVLAAPVRDARTPAASIGVRIPSGGVELNARSERSHLPLRVGYRQRSGDVAGHAVAAVLADYGESASRVQGTNNGDALAAEMLAHEHEWSRATVAPRIADGRYS